MEYDLELERVARTIKKSKVKLVLLQFPDGLKRQATDVASFLEKSTGATCLIWFGSCYGACDLPPVSELEKSGIKMIVQFGHMPWHYKRKDIKIMKMNYEK